MTLKANEIYDIPAKQNIPLRELEEKGIIDRGLAKKLILQRRFPAVKLGQKYFVPRGALIDWLQERLDNPTEEPKAQPLDCSSEAQSA